MDILFSLGGMQFEYDEEKNQSNIRLLSRKKFVKWQFFRNTKSFGLIRG